jgi:predicted enzyme related to lactoylglutathione lyase
MVRCMALTARMVTIDCADPGALAKFWSEAAGYEVTWRHENEYLVLESTSGRGLQLGLQRVPEPKAGKNRAHIDWATDDRPAEVDRLVGLGATVLDEHVLPGSGFAWTVLADPEGNEFCISGSHG